MSKKASKIPIRLKNYKFPDKYQSIAIQTSFNLNSEQLNTTFVIDKKDEEDTHIQSPIHTSTPFRRKVNEVEHNLLAQKGHESPTSSSKSKSLFIHDKHDHRRHHRSQKKANQEEEEEEEEEDKNYQELDMIYHDTSIEKPKRNVMEALHKKINLHDNQHSTGIFKQKSNEDDSISLSRSMIHFFLSDEDEVTQNQHTSRAKSHSSSMKKSKESDRTHKSKRDSSSDVEEIPKKRRRNIVLSSDTDTSKSEHELLERSNIYRTPKPNRSLYKRTDLTDKISKLNLSKTRNKTFAQMDFMDIYPNSPIEHEPVEEYGLPMESFDLHSDLENMFTDQMISNDLRNTDPQQPLAGEESNQRISASPSNNYNSKRLKSRRKKKRYTSSRGSERKSERFKPKNTSVLLRHCIEEIEKLLNPDPRLRRSERLRLKQLKKLESEKSMLELILESQNDDFDHYDKSQEHIDEHQDTHHDSHRQNRQHGFDQSHEISHKQDNQKASSSSEIIIIDSKNVTKRKTNPEYEEQQRDLRTSRKLFAPYVSLVRIDEE